MKVGFIGIGKLGFPCAVAMQMKGHDVMGYDIDPRVMNNEPKDYLETGPDGKEPFNPYLEKHPIKFGSMAEVAGHAEVIFVAVQTPHEPDYEGTKRVPDDRVDFNYSHLKACVSDLSKVVKKNTTIIIISTVLPGTFRKQILPFVNPFMEMCYNPYFIAMGTVMYDFFNPEFVLFGVHDGRAAAVALEFYKTITDAPVYQTTVENAELIKVLYNTFIGMKIVFANTAMELCHKIPGCHVDEVMGGLMLANERIISTKYLRGGMGDGGGCHPRDNIALSWLSEKLNLSHDFFEDIMLAREDQTEWLVDVIEYNHKLYKLPIVILGQSFKPGTNITVGSPAVLLSHLLHEREIRHERHDPYSEMAKLTHTWRKIGETKDGNQKEYALHEPSIFFLATQHDEFKDWEFPAGSVVIDPFRYLDKKIEGVKYIPIGVGEWSTLFA